MKFASACKKYFGFKQDQTLAQFVVEIKQLSKEDREEMAPLLAKELGEEVTAE